MKLSASNKTLQLRDSLFWDIDKPDAENSKKLIIERVVTRGNIEEFIQLIKFYPEKTLKEIVVKIGTLDKKTLNFLSFYFNISKDEFLCYKKMLSKNTRWNYL